MKNYDITVPMNRKSGKEILDMYYLEARSHLLETAAILDRIERAPKGNAAMEDQRVTDLLKMCEILTKKRETRAEQLLMMLSE